MTESTRGETFVMAGETSTSNAPVDFTTFLLGLASTAVIHLGVAPNPESGQVTQNMELARQSLDLLGLLREKTKGNLTPAEDRFFANLLADLRLKFVEATSR